MEIALDSRVDSVVRRGWYKGAAFWSPSASTPTSCRGCEERPPWPTRRTVCGYIMSTGFMPLLDDLADAGYDVHYYIDPVRAARAPTCAR